MSSISEVLSVFLGVLIIDPWFQGSNGWDELDQLSHSVRDAVLSSTMPEPEPLDYKPLFSFMQSAKTKLYNMYKSCTLKQARSKGRVDWWLGSIVGDICVL